MVPHARAETRAASDDPVIRRLADRGLYVGITAWTEPSLVQSGELYPPTATTAEERLRFYSSRYPITEVDSTFYHPPAERTAALSASSAGWTTSTERARWTSSAVVASSTCASTSRKAFAARSRPSR